MHISKKLIDDCIAGKQPRQKELYLLMLPYLRVVCMRYIKTPSLIKDVLQESFIDIFSGLKTYDEAKGEFHKWAVRITIHATFKYNKRVDIGAQEEFKTDVHDIPASGSSASEYSDEDLLNILKSMPSEFSEVFNLYVIDSYSHKEIGQMLKISDVNSRKKLSRARIWLKNHLKQNQGYLKDLGITQFILN